MRNYRISHVTVLLEKQLTFKNNYERNKKMKKYISIIVLLSLFVIGCSEQTSINSPVNDLNTNEPNWIALPQAVGLQY